MRASSKTTKQAATHNHGRNIKVSKYDSAGRIIASAEVSTLAAAHAFLDSLNEDGTIKASKRPSNPIPAPKSAPTLGDALMQATPSQQQQAQARARWTAMPVKRPDAGGNLYNAVRIVGNQFVEADTTPTHDHDTAKRIAARLNGDACPACHGLQWVTGSNLRPMPCRACHGSGKARAVPSQATPCQQQQGRAGFDADRDEIRYAEPTGIPDGPGKSPRPRGIALACAIDVLNPCYAGRAADVPGKHWAGGEACPACTARAKLDAFDEVVTALKALRGMVDVSTINNSKRSTAQWEIVAALADAALAKVQS